MKFIPEWHKHKATWLAWPENKNDWPGKFIPAKWGFAEIIIKVTEDEKLNLVVSGDKAMKDAELYLSRLKFNRNNLHFVKILLDRNWMRDIGPYFAVDENNRKIVLDLNFNGWAKYKNFQKDRALPKKVATKLKLDYHVASLDGKKVVVEGGGFDINGKGTLLTTSQLMLNEKIQIRNKRFGKAEYLQFFKKYGNVTNIIWLEEGIAGDDTNGHIDDIARFVSEKTIVYMVENNKSDINYSLLQKNREILESARLENGKKPELVAIPAPSPVFFGNFRLPASYANFYITNNKVLMPTFNDPNDKVALGVLSELFKEREVIGIHSTDLVLGLGSIHCLTQQEPDI